MARPAKTKVDYFPHMTHSGKTIAILEARWGNDGYAFWFKLLELLGDSNDFSFNCNHSADWEYLLSKTRVTEPVAEAILDKLAEIEAIDAGCWQQKIIWSDNLVRNLESVFVKRKQEVPQKPEFLEQKPDPAEVFGDFRDGNATEPDIIPTETDKEKESKPEQSEAEQTASKDNKAKKIKKPEEQEKPCPSSLRAGAVQQADTVFLTGTELARLQHDFGEEGAQRLITILDGYKTNNPDKGARYVDDYKAIHSWVVPRYRKEQSELQPGQRASPAASRPPITFIDKLAVMAKGETE